MATSAYHDSARALLDGFVPAAACESSAEGAMGVHHVNLARYSAHVLDASVDAARPEFLLYFPGAGGGRQRLAGVEYGVPVFVNGLPYYGSAPPDPRAINPAPSLFGHRFDGPMRGHNAAQPWHYDLHVWLWSENPAGIFAPWNPAWRCDGSYTPPTVSGSGGRGCMSSRGPRSRITGRPLARRHRIFLRGTASSGCVRVARTRANRIRFRIR